MTIKEKVQADTKEAMRAKDELRLSVLRLLSAAIQNREIEKRTKGGGELADDEVLATIRSEVKKRKDAIEQFLKGSREDLAAKETAELGILEKYLPAELSGADVEKIVKETVNSMGEVTSKDFGRVMGEVMKKIKGQASGERVTQAVKKILES